MALDAATSPVLVAGLSGLLRTGLQHSLGGALDAAVHCCLAWLHAAVSGGWACQAAQPPRLLIKKYDLLASSTLPAPFLKGESLH